MTTFDKAGNPVADIVHFKRVETNWRLRRPVRLDDGDRELTLKYDYATTPRRTWARSSSRPTPVSGICSTTSARSVFSPGGVVVHGPHDI